MSLINQLSPKKIRNIMHRNLAHSQRLAEEKVMTPISNWFENMQPFNKQLYLKDKIDLTNNRQDIGIDTL